jgi:hypothetical protein
MVSFLRGAPADCGQPDCGLILMVANADGTGIRALTPVLPHRPPLVAGRHGS